MLAFRDTILRNVSALHRHHHRKFLVQSRQLHEAKVVNAIHMRDVLLIFPDCEARTTYYSPSDLQGSVLNFLFIHPAARYWAASGQDQICMSLHVAFNKMKAMK